VRIDGVPQSRTSSRRCRALALCRAVPQARCTGFRQSRDRRPRGPRHARPCPLRASSAPQRGEHGPEIDDVEIVGIAPPPLPIRHGVRNAVGRGRRWRRRLAQALGRIATTGSATGFVARAHFSRGNAAKSVAGVDRLRCFPSRSRRRGAGLPAEPGRHRRALDVPTLGGAGPQICDSGILVGDCNADDIGGGVFYDRAAREVDKDIETESLQALTLLRSGM